METKISKLINGVQKINKLMTTLFRAVKFSDSGNKIIEKMINGVQKKFKKLMTILFRAIKLSASENKIIGKTKKKINDNFV